MTNDVLLLAQQAGLKLYLCEGFFCMAKECSKGQEIKDIEGGEQQYIESNNPAFGSIKEFIPALKEPWIITFADGTQQTIPKTIKLKKDCTERRSNELIQEELTALRALIKQNKELLYQYPDCISVQLNLSSLEHREKQILEELNH